MYARVCSYRRVANVREGERVWMGFVQSGWVGAFSFLFFSLSRHCENHIQEQLIVLVG